MYETILFLYSCAIVKEHANITFLKSMYYSPRPPRRGGGPDLVLVFCDADLAARTEIK